MKLARSTILKELRDIVILAVVGVIFNAIFFGDGIDELIVSALIWVFLYKGNSYVNSLVGIKIRWLEKPVMRVLIGIVTSVSYTVLALVTIIISYYYFVKGYPVDGIIKEIGINTLIFSILITLVISMFLHGRAFYLNWKEALYNVERLKNENLKAQYESLKNQVNPHFLFNSLNALSSLVYDDQKKAVIFIRKLSEIYRYVLDNREVELVEVKEELAFLENYVFLQKIRFGENLQLELDTKKTEGFVPPLSIQLLVENAIKHNVVSKDYPLTVRLVLDGEFVSVTNSIHEKKVKDSTGIGLENIKSRYSLLPAPPVEISNDGKVFLVKLPVLKLESSL
ncbi:histidine kinase [Flammeovirgaceae bacterium SG7u.111]|nr:histidine kinase [Flammeovirgaceae bacterium SG7u.132]WPO34589.1 histidine kinase [Flammeovirgaceae bacterium SG7u.111]